MTKKQKFKFKFNLAFWKREILVNYAEYVEYIEYVWNTSEYSKH